MRQLFKATLMLPLLLSVSTAVRAADDPAPPDANDANPPTSAAVTPPTDTPADTSAATSAAPNLGNVGDIGNVTSGKALPLTLKLNELGDNWRQLNISPQLETGDKVVSDLNNDQTRSQDDAMMQILMDALVGGPGIYFTQGQTVTTGDNTFLVAYSARFDALELKSLMGSIGKQKDAASTTKMLEGYLRNRTLNLALLNLHQVGSMSDIKPFNMEAQIEKLRTLLSFHVSARGLSIPASNILTDNTSSPPQDAGVSAPDANEIAPTVPEAPAPYAAPVPNHGDASANAVNDKSVASLRELGAGLQNYLEDHDGILPPMQDAIAAKAALKDYASIANFSHPGTKEAYMPNAILSGKKLAHITNPAAMVAFYEAHPAADGKRAILFLDGHVKRIKEAEWPLVKRASRVP